MTWRPPEPRPWVGRLNALGENLGEAGGAALVSLDEQDLLAAARRATGLTDFGDDGFREGLRILLDSLEKEARLSLLGRLFARSEIQRILQTRLQIADTFAQHPEIDDEKIEKPILITGLGRTGTTYLHELLSRDPESRVPMLWETMYPVPPPETATYATDPRIDRADREIRLMDEAVPAFPSMHENAGNLPTECIFLLAQEFATDMWTGEFEIPTYTIWMSGADRHASYEAHKRLLKLLQWRHRLDRWVLKAPSHFSQLPTVFDVYPDARVVITHRDPLKVLGSLTNLMATLRTMRSDHVDYSSVVAQMAFGYGLLVNRVVEQRENGEVPGDRIRDVHYRDLVSDPIGQVRKLYDGWGIEFTEEYRRRLESYVAGRPQDKRGTHTYSFADTGLDVEAERAKYVDYQKRYDVPSEV